MFSWKFSFPISSTNPPLNYIDVFSRMQIETLLLEYQPTMLFVEHDAGFCRRIATKTIRLDG